MSARRASSASRPGGHPSVSRPALVALVVLLLAPAWALSRLASTIDWPLLLGLPLALSLVSAIAYRSDKHRAEAGGRRIPESTLHLLSLAGGWPGAFLAQRLYRHKTAKSSFQLVFWLIVLAHQFLAIDALREWRFSRELVELLKSSAL